jgi:hypothetical protein
MIPASLKKSPAKILMAEDLPEPWGPSNTIIWSNSGCANAPDCRDEHLAADRGVELIIRSTEISREPAIEAGRAIPFQSVEIISHRIKRMAQAQPIDRRLYSFWAWIKFEPADDRCAQNQKRMFDILADALLESMVADVILMAEQIIAESEIEFFQRRERAFQEWRAGVIRRLRRSNFQLLLWLWYLNKLRLFMPHWNGVGLAVGGSGKLLSALGLQLGDQLLGVGHGTAPLKR